jgi:hypothetical protein
MMSGFAIPENSEPCWDPVIAGNGVGSVVGFAGAIVRDGVVYTGRPGEVVRDVMGTVVGTVINCVVPDGAIRPGPEGVCVVGVGTPLTGTIAGVVVTATNVTDDRDTGDRTKQYWGVPKPAAPVN